MNHEVESAMKEIYETEPRACFQGLTPDSSQNIGIENLHNLISLGEDLSNALDMSYDQLVRIYEGNGLDCEEEESVWMKAAKDYLDMYRKISSGIRRYPMNEVSTKKAAKETYHFWKTTLQSMY